MQRIACLALLGIWVVLPAVSAVRDTERIPAAFATLSLGQTDTSLANAWPKQGGNVEWVYVATVHG
jgi:hypothetical protein